MRFNLLNITGLYVLGSFIGSLGALSYRLTAFSLLTDIEYIKLILFVRSLELVISLAGFELHKTLTRDIIINRKSIRHILINFVWNYRITFALSIGAFILVLLATDIEYTLPVVLVGMLSLYVWSFYEYVLGISRGLRYIRKSAIISGLPGFFRGLIIVVLILAYSNISASFFIVFYFISLFLSLVFASWLIHPYWKEMFTIERPESKLIKDNTKSSGNLFYGVFIDRGIIWLVTFLAANILAPSDFKIFDFILLILSLVGIISSNLGITILQQYSTTNKIKFLDSDRILMVGIIGIMLVLSMAAFVILKLTGLDYILLNYFEIAYSDSIITIIRIFIFLPLLMVSSTISTSLLQAEGKFRFQSLIYSFSLPFVFILSLSSLERKIAYLVPLILISQKIVITLAYPIRTRCIKK